MAANLPARSDLRSEAVAALLMQDAHVVWERRWDTHVLPLPSVSRVGHRAAVAWLSFDNPTVRGVRLVDLADGSDIQIPKNPQMWGTAVGLSPDGTIVASPKSNNPTQAQNGMDLWDVHSGTLSKTVDWPQESRLKQVKHVAFTRDGRFLTASGGVGYVRGKAFETEFVVWNLETGATHTGSAFGSMPSLTVSFSADGKYLGYQSGRKNVSLRQMDSDEKPLELELPLSIMGSRIAFSPDGATFAVAGVPDDKSGAMAILLWDLVKNTERGRIKTEVGARLATLAFSPDGSLLAGSDEKGSIYFFDLATRNEVFRLQLAHQGIVNFLWWDTDSRHLLSSSIEGSLKYWELPGESLSATFSAKGSGGYFAVNPNGKQLAVLGSRREPGARLINRDTGQLERTWDVAEGSTPKPSRSRPELLLFRHDGRQLAEVGERLAVVWDVETGDEVASWEADPAIADELYSAAFTADGQLLASGKTGKYGKTAVVWNVATGERVWQAPRDYLQAHLSADGTRIAATPSGLAGQLSAPEAKRIAVWELATGRELDDLQGLDGEDSSTVVFPLFSPDGHWLVALAGLTGPTPPGITMRPLALAIGAANSHVALWHLPSGERRPNIRGSDAPTTYAFSPDSAMLAIGYRDGSAELWDVANHEVVFRWKQHSAPITHLAFSRDGTEIASSRIDSPNIRFLDLAGLRRQLADVGLNW